jgi:hypothetical protein
MYDDQQQQQQQGEDKRVVRAREMQSSVDKDYRSIPISINRSTVCIYVFTCRIGLGAATQCSDHNNYQSAARRQRLSAARLC